jgi:hypothetical protein
VLVGKDFIYVHVPKTGGQSIEMVLEPISESLFDQHSILFDAVKQDNINFDDKFKFGFVRNPYDLEVSNYFWHTRTNDRVNIDNFNTWIKWKYEEDSTLLTPDDFANEETYWYLKGFCRNPQVGFFVDNNAKFLSDFIGRYETINDDWNYICDKMDWNYKLGHHYPSVGRQKDYRQYYNEESYDIVTNNYKTDLEVFGYDFDGNFNKEIKLDYPIDIKLNPHYNYYYG